MFTSQEIKTNLLGCLEIVLFMPKGFERFEVTPKLAIQSFFLPIILLPFSMVVVVGLLPEFSPTLLISLAVLRVLISAVLFLSAVYFLVKQFDRQEHFYKFIMISNWMNIATFALLFPVVISFLTGSDPDAFEVYVVFVEIIGYIYSAYIVTQCFKLPWEMGGFIAVVGLAINENLFDLTEYIRDALTVAA